MPGSDKGGRTSYRYGSLVVSRIWQCGKRGQAPIPIKILEKQNKNGENQRLLHDVTGLKDITDEVRALNDDKSREVSNIGESAHIVSNGAESVKGGARFSKTASAGPGLNELSDEGVIEKNGVCPHYCAQGEP